MLVSSISYFNKKSFNEFFNAGNKVQAKVDNAEFGHIGEIQVSESNGLKQSSQNVGLSNGNLCPPVELEKLSLNLIA